MHPQISLDLARIEDMQRPCAVKGEEVGDIDKRRNRAQTDGLQARLKPSRAGPVLNAANDPTSEQGTAIQRVFVD